MSIAELRREYHRQLCIRLIRVTRKGVVTYPNFADGSSDSSVAIAWALMDRVGCGGDGQEIKGQRKGIAFETLTRDFLESAFKLLHHLRPGRWLYTTSQCQFADDNVPGICGNDEPGEFAVTMHQPGMNGHLKKVA